jgi:hypothetical protein
MFEALDVPRDVDGPTTDAGAALEAGVQRLLDDHLNEIDPLREWHVERYRSISTYEQYAHLERLNALIASNPTYRVEIGRDYTIAPDVVVGLRSRVDSERPLRLHAAVSCKWTIRSDRVQNIRHEAVLMIRHRRGRLPHIVAVTAEPLPSRIGAIARGTGEIDAVYHASLGALKDAVASGPWADQRDMLDELVEQHRLFDLGDLPRALAD